MRCRLSSIKLINFSFHSSVEPARPPRSDPRHGQPDALPRYARVLGLSSGALSPSIRPPAVLPRAGPLERAILSPSLSSARSSRRLSRARDPLAVSPRTCSPLLTARDTWQASGPPVASGPARDPRACSFYFDVVARSSTRDVLAFCACDVMCACAMCAMCDGACCLHLFVDRASALRVRPSQHVRPAVVSRAALSVRGDSATLC